MTMFAWHGYRDKGYWSMETACGEDKRCAFMLSGTFLEQLTRDRKCCLKQKISFMSFLFSLFFFSLLTVTCIGE